MKTHSTNYYDTFIEVADDCPTTRGIIPPIKNGEPTITSLQFDIMSRHPYTYTSDDVLFLIYTYRNDIAECDYAESRREFYSKGQACLRSSALGKRYGWGIHADHEGHLALYGMETEKYLAFLENQQVKCIKAMRSKST